MPLYTNCEKYHCSMARSDSGLEWAAYSEASGMNPQLKHIKRLLPDYKAKNWQFDLRICPDCNTLQRMKPMKVGSKCDGSGSPLFCDTEVIVCAKGKRAGELMWWNENWD